MIEDNKELMEEERSEGFLCLIFGAVMLVGAPILYVLVDYLEAGRIRKYQLELFSLNVGPKEIFIGFLIFVGLFAIVIGIKLLFSGRKEEKKSEKLVDKGKQEQRRDPHERVKFKSDERFRR